MCPICTMWKFVASRNSVWNPSCCGKICFRWENRPDRKLYVVWNPCLIVLHLGSEIKISNEMLIQFMRNFHQIITDLQLRNVWVLAQRARRSVIFTMKIGYLVKKNCWMKVLMSFGQRMILAIRNIYQSNLRWCWIWIIVNINT